jgi:hypothetical protein
MPELERKEPYRLLQGGGGCTCINERAGESSDEEQKPVWNQSRRSWAVYPFP